MRTLPTIIFSTLLSSAIVIASLWAFHSFYPQSTLFGSTITTINGSDTLSNSRSTINTNYANLNATKEEISDIAATTSLNRLTTLPVLASIGTITTGVWNGTPLTVAFGGTGSTTLSANQLLLGNGTGIIKTVAGFGTSGQFLTSNGAGVAPSFQSASVDQTANYAWTGNHNFTGTTLIKTLNASSTIVWGGVSLTAPANQGTSGQFLQGDGAGNMSFQNATEIAIATTSITYTHQSSGVAYSVASTTIPGGTLAKTRGVRIRAYVSNFESNDAASYQWICTYGGSNLAVPSATVGGSLTLTYGGFIECDIYAGGATNSQVGWTEILLPQQNFTQSGTAKDYLHWTGTGSTAVDSTANQTASITLTETGTVNAASTITVPFATFEKIQ